MRTEERTATRVITADSGKEFERLLNEALKDCSRVERIEFNYKMGHCAYILYKYDEKILESVKDRYVLDGDLYRCGECPFYVAPDDGRKKYGFCNHIHDSASGKDDACTWFYRELAKGEIEV